MIKPSTIDNSNLISTEEQKWADLLKRRNLNMVNFKDNEVHPADNLYIHYFKRWFDLIVGVPVFVILLPINFVFGICTFLDVGSPIFYEQARSGKDGKPFIMVKFRNMTNELDSEGKLLPANERVTKFGKFMRRYSFDELLNFWSVVKGDMSIIGPRPLPVFFTDRMSERHKMRNSVRPGLECPYEMPEDTDISAYHWKFENDIWYIENASFKTDLLMMGKLLKLVLNSKKRSSHAGGLSYFVGYDDDGYATSLKKAQKVYVGEFPNVHKK